MIYMLSQCKITHTVSWGDFENRVTLATFILFFRAIPGRTNLTQNRQNFNSVITLCMISSARDCTKKLKVAKLTQFSKSPQLMVPCFCFQVRCIYNNKKLNYVGDLPCIKCQCSMQLAVYYNTVIGCT